MPEGSIRAIFVGSGTAEHNALQEMLEADRSCGISLKHAVDFDTGMQSLQEHTFDVALLELGVSDRYGLEAFSTFRERAPQTPVIVLLKAQEEQIADALIQAGAQDYLIKEQLSAALLVRSIRYSILQIQSQEDLGLANKQVANANHAIEHAISNTTQLTRDAEANDAVLKRFLADLNYEITTSINGIIPIIGILLETDLDREQRELVKMVSDSSEALLLVLHDVINSSRLDTGPLDLEIAPFELRTSLEEQNNLLALRAYDKGLEYACMVLRDVPSCVKGDARRLRQILDRVVDSVIKVTSTGEIVLNLTVDTQDDKHACLRFSVNYSGNGVPGENKDNLITENFYGKNSEPADISSNRSGLETAKQLVELMGGEMGVESYSTHGSTFWFTVILEKQASDQVPAETIAELLRGVRVLVVDDSTTMLKVCSDLLDAWGCRSHESKDAASAIDALHAAVDEKDPFDVVLIDTGLEGIDGKGLGEVIQSDSSLDGLALILMTSLLHRGEASQLKRRGFNTSITKPLRRKQLYDGIVMALGRDSKIEASTDAALTNKRVVSESSKREVHILVAEDNIVNQKVALKILSKLGYQADLVENGLEAIRMLMTAHYDIVLMDILMPRMGGIEATNIIRDTASAVRDHDVPIIALTADTMSSADTRCLEAGMNDFMPKPIDPEKLAATIEKWVR
ncbi:MAG: response regulator [Deltaproteobacteria bacterium]|nr:response regulator [Deltaproteobacteria bacterium]